MEVKLTNLVNSCWELIYRRNQYTGDHCRAVGLLSGRLAKDLGLEKETIDDIQLAGKVHDFGKILWEDNLLFEDIKRSQLNDSPRRKIEEHPTVAKNHFYYSFYMEGEELGWIIPLWFHHWTFKKEYRKYPHPDDPNVIKFLTKIEKLWNKEKLELVIGIMKVADCFHAGVAGRRYREEHTEPKKVPIVVEEISKEKGIIYHPDVVSILKNNLAFLEDEFVPSLYPTY